MTTLLYVKVALMANMGGDDKQTGNTRGRKVADANTSLDLYSSLRIIPTGRMGLIVVCRCGVRGTSGQVRWT